MTPSPIFFILIPAIVTGLAAWMGSSLGRTGQALSLSTMERFQFIIAGFFFAIGACFVVYGLYRRAQIINVELRKRDDRDRRERAFGLAMALTLEIDELVATFNKNCTPAITAIVEYPNHVSDTHLKRLRFKIPRVFSESWQYYTLLPSSLLKDFRNLVGYLQHLQRLCESIEQSVAEEGAVHVDTARDLQQRFIKTAAFGRRLAKRLTAFYVGRIDSDIEPHGPLA
ncbi:MAG: hypothetical protein U9N14_06825 [Pseudomonadota bacterium]|nr:hypothetical protein [Pseudomonadota bacterium]